MLYYQRMLGALNAKTVIFHLLLLLLYQWIEVWDNLFYKLLSMFLIDRDRHVIGALELNQLVLLVVNSIKDLLCWGISNHRLVLSIQNDKRSCGSSRVLSCIFLLVHKHDNRVQFDLIDNFLIFIVESVLLDVLVVPRSWCVPGIEGPVELKKVEEPQG